MGKNVSYGIKGKNYNITTILGKKLDLLKSLKYLEIIRIGNEKNIKCERESIKYKGYDDRTNTHIISLCGKAKAIDVFGKSSLDNRLFPSIFERDLNLK